MVLCWIAAHYLSWFQPRALQHALKFVTYPMQLLTLNRLMPQQTYSEKDISPYIWPNGKLPVRDDWKRLAEGHFRDFKLKVGGLVENPVELSLADLRNLGELEHIAMHHCIQGWSGIAKWGGIPMKALIELVRPRPKRTPSPSSPLAKRSTAGPTTIRRALRTCSSRNACSPAR